MHGPNPRVNLHYNHAVEQGYDVWVTMLYGSQNYGLSTPESDVDTKTMVFPSVNDVVLGKKMTSLDLVLPSDGSLNNVKDYRGMFQNYLKGNINFLETLYTDYWVVDPMYEREYFQLREHRELIANSQPCRLVHMAAGMAQQKYVAMEKYFESKKEVLEKYGYDPKQLHHLVRLYYFIKAFEETGSFEKSLRPTDEQKKWLLSLKTAPLELEKAREVKETYKGFIEQLVEWANDNMPEEAPTRKFAKDYLDELALMLFRKRYNLS